MTKFLTLGILVIFPALAVAQHKPQINKPADVENAAQKTALLSAPKLEVPMPSVEVGFPMTIPAMPRERNEIPLSQEFEDFKEKKELVYIAPPNFAPTGAAVNPIKLKLGMESNKGDTSAPLDNTVSASNDDYVVSISNGIIEVYHQDSKPVYRAPLRTFFSNKLKGPCDPKVIFDPLEKKFIIFAQRCEDQYAESQIIVGFSSSSNPLEKWNFYLLSGNPLNQPTFWFDYPKIGISKDGLFISGHIFNGANQLQETVVYQIDKDLGFKGNTLEYVVWHNLVDKPIILQPATYAFNDLSGNGIFLIGTVWQDGANYVRLYDISGNIRSNPQMKLYKVPTANYYFFAKAVQKDQPIDNGDVRMQDALLFDNKIAFVFTSGLEDRYFSRVNINVMDLSNLTIQSKLLGDNVNHSYAFPSIGLISNQGEAVSLFVLYNGTSDNSFPDIRYKACDINLSCSQEFLLRGGESTINNYERWGDYSGTSKNRIKKGELWLSSTYGKNSTRQTFLANVVANVAGTDIPAAIPVVSPAIENISFTAYTKQNVRIVLKKDGASYKSFPQEVSNGKNIFQLFTQNLEKGIYQIDVFSAENKLIKSVTFTKE